jgi:hypothetical protein
MSPLVLALLILLQQPTSEKITEGFRPRVSPDGRWLAFQRSVEDHNKSDLRGDAVYRWEAWIRDLRSGEERRVADDSWVSGWVDATTIVFCDGTTAAAEGKPIEVAKRPTEDYPSNRAWAPGGKRMAFTPAERWSKDSDRKLYIQEGAAKPAAVALGHDLLSEDPGFLAWTPDGRRLMFHQKFFRYGNLPIHRIGVIDVAAGTHRFVGEGQPNRGFSECERWGDSPGTWDAKGERFVFVTGRGGSEADIFVSNAAGSEVLKLTEDDECKWSPALDPAGRRVAFCAGRVVETPKERDGLRTSLAKCRIRVLDLYSGRETVIESGETPSSIAWMTDGSGLLIDSDGIHVAKLPAPGPLAPGAAIVSKPALSLRERILEALESPNESIIEWGAERGEKDVLPALRAALRRCTQEKLVQAERALLYALSRLNAREGAPEVIAALGSEYEANRILALRIAGSWRLTEATDSILKLVDALPATETNVHAAGALAWLSHPTGWTVLKRFLESGDKDIRGAVVSSLEGLADPGAVDILIRLVEDSADYYIGYQVGEKAERALARITGKTFDRKAGDWLVWWSKQGGRLPEVPDPNPALKKLDEERERRERERLNKRGR